MAILFNPCLPCCETKRVLVYTEYEAACQDYATLAQYYTSTGAAVDRYSCGQTPPPEFDLESYDLVFMIMGLANDPRLDPAPVAAWLAGGQRRLVITGEHGPAWDASIAWANDYCAALGVPLAGTQGTLVAFIACGVDGPSDIVPGHYLVDGLEEWQNHASCVVTGGTPLAEYGAGNATLAVAPLTGSEVVYSGDSNCFGGGGPCALPPVNHDLLYRLLYEPVQ